MLELLQATALGHFLMTLVSFVLLLLIVYKFAWGPISKILEDRQQKIENEQQMAEADRTKAQSLAEEAEADRKQARQDANDILQASNQRIEQEKQRSIEEAEIEISRKRRRDEEAIEQERKDMIAAMGNQVADLSVDIASQILQREVSAEDHQQLIDDLILEMDGKDEE